MSSIDISSCKTSSELFEHIQMKSGLSGSKLADKIGITSQYVSAIKKGDKVPSEDVLKKLSDSFQLNYEQCIEIREADNIKRDTTRAGGKKVEHPEHTQDNTNGDVIVDENIQLNNLFQQLSSLPEEIQEKVEEALKDLIIKELIKSGGIFTTEEMEQKLKAISLKWYETQPSTYNSVNISEELKGFVDIENEKIYVEITADKHLISISTLHKHQNHLKDILSLVPGLYAEEYSMGNLGKIYKDVSLFHRRLFNVMGLLDEIKNVMAHHHLNPTRLTFQEFNLNTFLCKDNKEGIKQ